ncbi:pseudouridine synthase [Rhodoferax sediminis]|uniref:Pseudouridine synthase n=1 Tax=Rhodoferax sediminis TaxID=2509614 RepID=A0A515D9T5_9BURK|nr:pseudouridine synthase [Rhodoferax sediminis]QDL37159.1 pseudouridine synthase [Rhodoferax sediminis]
MSTPRHALPPTRNGVGPSCVGLPAGDWPTITDFLVQRFPAIDRAVWLQRMHEGHVVDEHGVPVTPARAYQGHLRVYYYRDLVQEPRIPFDEVVLYQDEHLVVVDKPHFLPVTPSGRYLQETLLVRLKRKLGIDTLQPIHRIDLDTAGVVVFSIQSATRDAYHALFRRHEVAKQYEAIAPWRAGLTFPCVRHSRIVAGAPFFRLCEAAGAPNAETRIDVLEINGALSRYRLEPTTGRKHQLRVHMAALGIPIVNDRFYPSLVDVADDDFSRPLQLLARSIAFLDPVTGQARRFKSAYRLSLGHPGTTE